MSEGTCTACSILSEGCTDINIGMYYIERDRQRDGQKQTETETKQDRDKARQIDR